MALIRFTSPYARQTGTKQLRIEAENLRDALRQVVQLYPSVFQGLLDTEEKLTHKAVVFVGGRNAWTLKGADTSIENDTDVLIVPFLSNG
jgi:molybdopterin converting factor small subunit